MGEFVWYNPSTWFNNNSTVPTIIDESGVEIPATVAQNTMQYTNPSLAANTNWSAAGLTGSNGLFTNADGSFNWNNIGSVANAGLNLGLGAMNAYTGWQNMKTAKDAFNFNKQLATTNLNNSIKSYNTKLGDVARTRSIMETGSDGAYSDWYNQNKATGLNGE